MPSSLAQSRTASSEETSARNAAERNFWQPFTTRYRQGEWRATVFRDLILRDLEAAIQPPTVLDIGCGRGFDGSQRIQEHLAAAAGRFLGVEPDHDVNASPAFHSVFRQPLEEVQSLDGQVDLAYSVMVLEHLQHPQSFWDAAYRVLKPGGVFWGVTVDARHYFTKLSRLMDSMRIKDLYLRLLLGRRGTDRYENYPVHYASNDPKSIGQLAKAFATCDFATFARPGDVSHYYPRLIKPIFGWLDRRVVKADRHGYLLAVRAQKAIKP